MFFIISHELLVEILRDVGVGEAAHGSLLTVAIDVIESTGIYFGVMGVGAYLFCAGSGKEELANFLRVRAGIL
jgi:hypothetical protein